MLVIIAATVILTFADCGIARASIYDDVAAYWKFDDSGNTVTDETGTNTATKYGNASWGTGVIGGAIDYSSGGYAVASDDNSLDITSALTITAWINLTTAATDQEIVGKVNSNASGSCYEIRLHAGRIRFLSQPGSTWNTYQTTDPVITNTGTWYHIAMAYPSTTIYINGSAVDGYWASGGESTLQSNNTPLHIGGTFYLTPFYGLIDELAIYDRMLDAYEIDAIYDSSVEAFESITAGVNETFGLSYSTDEINQLSQLYAEQGSRITIDGMNWRYLDTLPDEGNHEIGDSYVYNGTNYIYLGSGLEGGAAPELPKGAIPVLSLLCIIGLVVLERKVSRSEREERNE